MKTIELSAKQRQDIEQRRRQAPDRRVYQRLCALLWIDQGQTRQQVADLLGVTSRQVGDWLRIFRNKGLDELCTLHYRGDPGHGCLPQLRAGADLGPGHLWRRVFPHRH